MEGKIHIIIIVHELCTEAALSEDLDLETLLNEDDQISELFSLAEISELLDPSKNTGQCAEMVSTFAYTNINDH